MKPVAIFRHFACEGPGTFADFLDGRGIPHRLIAIDQNEAVPDSIGDYSGLVFMGGPMSVNDGLPWISEEIGLIRQARDAGIPVLGHCLGGQLIAKALGGSVGPNPVREIGWHDVEQTGGDACREWLPGLPGTFSVFHWHGETFTLPEGAAPILTNRWCENQGFVIGNMLALQCHVEMTADMVREWTDVNRHELEHPTPSLQSADQMLHDLDARVEGLRLIANTLYGRWAEALRA